MQSVLPQITPHGPKSRVSTRGPPSSRLALQHTSATGLGGPLWGTQAVAHGRHAPRTHLTPHPTGPGQKHNDYLLSLSQGKPGASLLSLQGNSDSFSLISEKVLQASWEEGQKPGLRPKTSLTHIRSPNVIRCVSFMHQASGCRGRAVTRRASGGREKSPKRVNHQDGDRGPKETDTS